MLIEAGEAEGDDHVEALETEHAGALGVVADRHASFGQGGVEVDRVRHHGRADDPDGDVDRLGVPCRPGSRLCAAPPAEGPILSVS